MKLNPKKINISESDIEDYFYENPEKVELFDEHVVSWLFRQMKLPSGIADLVGITNLGTVLVVELKNTDINSNALTQVKRYEYDLSSIMYKAGEEFGYFIPVIKSAVIGKGIDDKTFFEANALGIYVMNFSVEIYVPSVSPLSWKREFQEKINSQYSEIAKSPEVVNAVSALFEKASDRLTSLSAFDETLDSIEEKYND